MIKNITLGQYFPGTSPIHKLDPRIKLVLAIAVIVIVFIVGYIGYACVAALVIATTLLSKVPFSYLLKGLKPLRIIIIFTFIMNLFFLQQGNTIFEWWIIRITDEALARSIEIVIRLVLLICTTTMLTLTTSPMEITDGLEKLLGPLKVIRFPVHELALMMSIAIRFIPTLMEETDKIMKAQTARGAEFDSGGFIKKAKGMVPLLVPLFVSAFKRADELSLAMEARCYNGGAGRTRMKKLKMTYRDLVASLVVACLIVVAILGY